MRSQLAIISLLTAASQLAAFVKLWFTARIFGVGPELDGYNLALVLPTLISGVLAGVLQTGLFPVRARLNAEGNRARLDAFERSFMLIVALTGIVIATVLMLSASHIAGLLSTSGSESVKAAVAFALPSVAMLVALNMIGDSTGFLLAMRDRFAIAAGAPLANGLLGATMLAAWPAGGLLNLVAGTVLGLALQVTICVWGLHRSGFRFIGTLPTWSQLKHHWVDMTMLGAWILPGVVFSNLVVSLPTLWVTRFGEGAVSAFGYAYRLHSSALQLIVMASSTVILARFSDLVAQNDDSAVRAILAKAAIVSAIIGVIAVVSVWGVGGIALQWVFGGRFDALAAERVAQHWLWLTLGLPFAVIGNVFAKLWQAQRKPRLISGVAGFSLIAMTLTYISTSSLLLEVSLAAALSTSALSVVLIGWYFIKPISTSR